MRRGRARKKTSSKAAKAKAPARRRAVQEPRPLPVEVLLANDLNTRQDAFARHYSIFGNGTRAAIEAGYAPNTAAQQAWDLLRNPKVEAEVRRLQGLRAARYEVTADNIKAKAAQIGFTDIAECFVPGTNHLLEITEMSENARALISGFEHGYTTERRGRKGNQRTREAVVKIKTKDSIAALELLAKLIGALKDAGQAPPYTGPAFILPAGTRVKIE